MRREKYRSRNALRGQPRAECVGDSSVVAQQCAWGRRREARRRSGRGERRPLKRRRMREEWLHRKCGCWQRSCFSSKTEQLQGTSKTNTRLPSPPLLLTLMLIIPSRSAIPRPCAGGSRVVIPNETLGSSYLPLAPKSGWWDALFGEAAAAAGWGILCESARVPHNVTTPHYIGSIGRVPATTSTKLAILPDCHRHRHHHHHHQRRRRQGRALRQACSQPKQFFFF